MISQSIRDDACIDNWKGDYYKYEYFIGTNRIQQLANDY